MQSTVTIEIPASFTQALAEVKGEASLPRWALEALVVEAVREGLITRGFGGELLGLGFHQREGFYSDHGITYDLTDEDLEQDRKTLRRILRLP